MQTKMESPSALAGAAGADIQDWLDWIDDNIRWEVGARKLAVAILHCDPSHRLELLERFYDVLRPGVPIIAFDSLMTEAAFWADRASLAERKAYSLACFNRMPTRDQAAFIDYVQARASA